MDNGRIIRILRLLTALQSGRCSVQDLVQLLGLSRRTLFRDLNVLRKAGIPVVHDHATGQYCIESGFFLPPIHLNQEEAYGALLALRKVAPQLALPFQDAIRSAALKLEGCLSEAVRQDCQKKLSAASIRNVRAGTGKFSERTFSLLQEAVASCSIVEIQYAPQSDAAAVRMPFCPVHLLQSGGDWYVVGRCAEASQAEMQSIRLSTIRQVKPLARKFLTESPFHISQHLGDAWAAQPEGKMYNVILRFSSEIAEEVAAVQWHRTQRCQRRSDGSIILDFRIDGLNEILRWILSYGSQVQVLAPLQLRDRVHEIAAQTAAANQRA